MAPPPRAFMSGWHSCMSRNAASAPDSHAVYMSSSVHVVERTRRHLLRVVHQHVDATEALDRSGDDRLAVGDRSRTLPATAIASPPSAWISSTVRDPVVGVALEDGDARARLGERERDAASDAAPAAGDDGDLVHERLLSESHVRARPAPLPCR